MVELNGTPQSKAALVAWLRNKHPNFYRQIMLESGVNLGDFAETISKIFNTVKDTVATLGPVYVQTRAELELLKVNIARARQGLNPVNSLPNAAPPPAVVDQSGTAVASSGLPGWVIPVAIGVAALLFLRR